MWEELKKTVFKTEYKKISKLKGEKKEEEYLKLIERMEMYSVAKDFSEFYPTIYTHDMLNRIANAKNNIEAENILVSLRKRQGEYVC